MVTIAIDLRNRPHALYRFFDADDRLLYVGLTADPGARWKTHSRTKPWWTDVKRVEVEHFPDRESVEAAEIFAIATEKPVHNVAHQMPEPDSTQDVISPARVTLDGDGWTPPADIDPALRPILDQLVNNVWLRPGDVATLFGNSRWTVINWLKNGYKIGGQRYYIGYRETGGGHRELDPDDVKAALTAYRTLRTSGVPTDGALSLKQVHERLAEMNVDIQTVRAWADAGRFGLVRKTPGGHRRFEPAAVDEAIRAWHGPSDNPTDT